MHLAATTLSVIAETAPVLSLIGREASQGRTNPNRAIVGTVRDNDLTVVWGIHRNALLRRKQFYVTSNFATFQHVSFGVASCFQRNPPKASVETR